MSVEPMSGVDLAWLRMERATNRMTIVGVLILSGRVRHDQLRVFRDPRLSSRWLVKRVGEVYGSGATAIFEARSDNPRAPSAADSHEFGPVSAAGSYRVVFKVRAKVKR